MSTKKKPTPSPRALRLRDYLAAQGLSHYEASRRLGFSRPDYVYRLVTGRAPVSDGVLWRILRTFGVDAALQIAGDDEE